MTLRGNYEDIRRFIHQVENGTDFIVIDSIALQQGERPARPNAGALVVDVLPRGGRWTVTGGVSWRWLQPRFCSSDSRVEHAARHGVTVRSRSTRMVPRSRTLRNDRRARSPGSISTRSNWNDQSRTTAPEIPSGSSQSLTPPTPSAAIIRQQQQAAAAAQAASEPSEPPPPPRIPLKYIGDMSDPKHSGKRIAILSDARGTYYGREGDVVEGRYRIVKIGVESIELAYLDGRGRQTIRQTGQ